MPGFSKEYWDQNYSQPQEMDGIFNAKEHARYAKAIMDLDFGDVKNMADLGMGLGYLSLEFLRAFRPKKFIGVEPSKSAFESAKKKIQPHKWNTQIRFQNLDLIAWLNRDSSSNIFDLGICTSVFQYVLDSDIPIAFEGLAKKFRYLYFSVPTDVELSRQRQEFKFDDTYALRRPKEFYLKALAPYFAIVGQRLLESRVHYHERNTPFSDLLFHQVFA